MVSIHYPLNIHIVLFSLLFCSGYGWPLDYHFVFNVVAVFGIVLIIISLFLPKSIEKKRERPNVAQD